MRKCVCVLRKSKRLEPANAWNFSIISYVDEIKTQFDSIYVPRFYSLSLQTARTHKSVLNCVYKKNKVIRFSL